MWSPVNLSFYLPLLRGEKGAGRGEGKAKKSGWEGLKGTGPQTSAVGWQVPSPPGSTNVRSDWSHGSNQTQRLTLEITCTKVLPQYFSSKAKDLES